MENVSDKFLSICDRKMKIPTAKNYRLPIIIIIISLQDQLQLAQLALARNKESGAPITHQHTSHTTSVEDQVSTKIQHQTKELRDKQRKVHTPPYVDFTPHTYTNSQSHLPFQIETLETELESLKMSSAHYKPISLSEGIPLVSNDVTDSLNEQLSHALSTLQQRGQEVGVAQEALEQCQHKLLVVRHQHVIHAYTQLHVCTCMYMYHTKVYPRSPDPGSTESSL